MRQVVFEKHLAAALVLKGRKRATARGAGRGVLKTYSSPPNTSMKSPSASCTKAFFVSFVAPDTAPDLV